MTTCRSVIREVIREDARSVAGAAASGGGGIINEAIGLYFAADYDATAKAIPNRNATSSLQTGMVTRNPRGAFATSIANQGVAGTGGWLGGGFGGCTTTDKYAAGRDGVFVATRAVFSGAWWGITYRAAGTLPAGTYTMVIDAKSNTGSNQDFQMSRDDLTTTVTRTATADWQQFKYEFTLASPTAIGTGLRFLFPPSGNGDFVIDKAFLWAGNEASVPADIDLGGHLYLGNMRHETISCTGGELALTSSQNGQIDFSETMETQEVTLFALVQRVGAYQSAGAGRYPILNTNLESASGGANGDGFALGAYDGEANIVGNMGTTRQALPYGALGDNIFPNGSCPDLLDDGGYHVLSFQAKTKVRNLWIDDCVVAQTYNDAWTADNISTNHLEIGFNKGLAAFKVSALAVFDRSLTAAERHSVIGELITDSGVAVTRPKNLLIAEGDSITVGPASNSYAQQYLTNAGGTAFSIFNIAAQAGSMLNANGVPELNLAVRLPSHLAGVPQNLAGRKAVLTLFFGANDLGGYASAAAYLADYYSYVAQAKAAGFTVGICTILAKGTAQSGYVAFNVLRNAVNTQLRLDVGDEFDFLIDFATDATMGTDAAPNNATYFSTDGLHPNAAGHALLEPIYRAAVNAVLV